MGFVFKGFSYPLSLNLLAGGLRSLGGLDGFGGDFLDGAGLDEFGGVLADKLNQRALVDLEDFGDLGPAELVGAGGADCRQHRVKSRGAVATGNLALDTFELLEVFVDGVHGGDGVGGGEGLGGLHGGSFLLSIVGVGLFSESGLTSYWLGEVSLHLSLIKSRLTFESTSFFRFSENIFGNRFEASSLGYH